MTSTQWSAQNKQGYALLLFIDFELISEIQNIETIAVGSRIRDWAYLQKTYGRSRWRKLKGIAQVRLPNGRIRLVVNFTGMKRMA